MFAGRRTRCWDSGACSAIDMNSVLAFFGRGMFGVDVDADVV